MTLNMSTKYETNQGYFLPIVVKHVPYSSVDSRFVFSSNLKSMDFAFALLITPEKVPLPTRGKMVSN